MQISRPIEMNDRVRTFVSIRGVYPVKLFTRTAGYFFQLNVASWTREIPRVYVRIIMVARRKSHLVRTKFSRQRSLVEVAFFPRAYRITKVVKIAGPGN